VSDTPAEQPDAELGALRRITGNRYRIVRRITSGGMAHVYLGQHALLGRRVVIKVLHAHLSADSEMRERFRREAEAACELVHPHICPILDLGEVNGSVYIVMPFLAGGSLADRIVQHSTIETFSAAAITAQVACALDYSSRRGVVHRDIKPDNVLFDEDGNAVITDFGIATARFHARLTATGRAMGTPHYMAPEQAMGRMVDGRSDLYGLGVMFYEMLLGFPPFDGADNYSVSYKQVHEAPVPPDEVESRVPPELASIIMRLLEKNPASRFQRGHEVADALITFLAAAQPAGGEERRLAWVARRGGPASAP
jgi:serine/threonine protein kinase